MRDADRGIVFVAGTADTKGAELAYVRDIVRDEGIQACLVDLSTRPGTRDADVTSDMIAACHPDGAACVFVEDRGRAVAAMAIAFERHLRDRGDVAGVIGLGGSGGTALITTAMRALPIGVPKLMVSTVASSNVAPFVGASDIAMMYSVTDFAGLNRISRVVLANAARAIAGMARGAGGARHAGGARDAQPDKPAVGLTMFGVTTPCVNAVVELLRADYDCLVFHATGTGGQSLEKLAASGLLAGALDATTTEVCDFLVGGVFACDQRRLDVFAAGRLPYVGSCGALDMVNFGAVETVPAPFRGRTLHVHNPQVTLMRTTADECAHIGRWIGTKLNACEGEVRFLLPRRGVSALDAPGMAFFDPQADAALFDALHGTVRQTGRRRLIDLDLHINDAAFASAFADAFRDIAGR